jgi:hypothetical protein
MVDSLVVCLDFTKMLKLPAATPKVRVTLLVASHITSSLELALEGGKTVTRRLLAIGSVSHLASGLGLALERGKAGTRMHLRPHRTPALEMKWATKWAISSNRRSQPMKFGGHR